MVEYGNSRPTPKGCKTKERHMIAMTGRAKGKKMSFCGPGTCLTERLNRGDKPVNYNDWCCLQHDKVYNRKDATRAEIQKSDDDLKKCLAKNPNKSIGSKVEANIMKAVFKGKRKLENVGILDPAKLTDTQLYKKEKKGTWLKDKVKGYVKGKVAKDRVEQQERKANKYRKRVRQYEKAEKTERLTEAGKWSQSVKITSAAMAEAKRSKDVKHLAREPPNVSLEGHYSKGLDRRIGGNGVPGNRNT